MKSKVVSLEEWKKAKEDAEIQREMEVYADAMAEMGLLGRGEND